MKEQKNQRNCRRIRLWTFPVALMLAVGAAGCSRGGETASGSGEPARATIIPEKAVTAYFAIQEALASDSTEGIGQKTDNLVQAWPDKRIASGAERLSEAEGLNEAREAFKSVSNEVIRGLEGGEYKLAGSNAQQAYCPMAKAAWLQQGDQVNNPYYGSSMLRCGEIRMTYKSN